MKIVKNEVSVYELEPGMIVNDDIYGARGQLLIKKGVCLTENYIYYLKRSGIKRVDVSEPAQHSSREDLAREHARRDPEDVSRGFRIERVMEAELQDLQKEPQHIATFYRELVPELPALCKKVLIAPCLDEDDVHPILTQLDSIIQRPAVLNALLKVRLIEESALIKAVQVAALAAVMGQRMGMSQKDLDNITIAALLYDIGNFWISRALLSKPELYDEREKQIVEEHTIIGYLALKDYFDEEVARVAYQHHERHNGSGYPCRASEDEIDLFAKIISICDVYMSLIAPRPFRQKYEPLEALEYILGAGGTLFDPEIVEIFLDIIPLYSVGSMVQLSNNCIAVVTDTTGKPLGRPVVEIIFDENGQPTTPNQVLDLKEHLTISIKKIL